AALFETSDRARTDSGKARGPILLLSGGQDHVAPQALAIGTCAALPACTNVKFEAGHHDLHMESDVVREAWIQEIERFIHARIAARAPRHGDQPHGL
ncbi:MAG: alpha/beta hydrolase, partial [bacterium]|nr:alpha/beta hydrolase [bacterium]